MARELSEQEIKKRLALMIWRNQVALKHRINATEEKLRNEPAFEAGIDALNASGRPWSLEVPEVGVRAISPGEGQETD